MLVAVASLLWLGTSVEGANVTCPSQSLQAAINAASPGTTLLITGTCTGNVRIWKPLTLDRGATRPTITAASGNVISVDSPGVTVRRLRVTGGLDAISVGPGTNTQIRNNIIENADGVGILVVGAFAAIFGNTIRNNAEGGIEVGSNSGAAIEGNVIHDNEHGIIVGESSSASIQGNTIRNNPGNGVLVEMVSSASLGGNTINANGQSGILVTGNSGVKLGHHNDPNTTTINNGGHGIRCRVNSSAEGRRGSLNGTLGARSFPSAEGCIDRTIP